MLNRLNSEIFTLPVAAGKYLVYAPLRLAAFVTNARTVNLLAEELAKFIKAS